VTLPASVQGRERARLFCGLRLPEDALDALSVWQAEHIRGARPVPREHLHVTLAFLGHRPVEELGPVGDALRAAVEASRPITLVPERYRETRSVGMLVLKDAEGAATSLAEDLQERLERAGAYERERRPWLPHLTVARFRDRPRLRPPLPELGEVAPSDAAVFISELRPSGARYVVVDSFALGG
jgi:RNA 2',3'-cyclic 3'-phosphodiesterase